MVRAGTNSLHVSQSLTSNVATSLATVILLVVLVICCVFLSFCLMLSPSGLDCYPTLNRWKTVKQQKTVIFLGPHAPQQKGRIQAWIVAINLSEFLPTRKGRTQSADRHEEICSSPSSGLDRKIEPVLHVFEAISINSQSPIALLLEWCFWTPWRALCLNSYAVLLLSNWFFLVHCSQGIKC